MSSSPGKAGSRNWGRNTTLQSPSLPCKGTEKEKSSGCTSSFSHLPLLVIFSPWQGWQLWKEGKDSACTFLSQLQSCFYSSTLMMKSSQFLKSSSYFTVPSPKVKGWWPEKLPCSKPPNQGLWQAHSYGAGRGCAPPGMTTAPPTSRRLLGFGKYCMVTSYQSQEAWGGELLDRIAGSSFPPHWPTSAGQQEGKLPHVTL